MKKYRATAIGWLPVELSFEFDLDESDETEEPGYQALDQAEDTDGEQWTVTDYDVESIEVTNVEPVEEG